MSQVIEMYVNSTGSMSARLSDGDVRPLSIRESSAILRKPGRRVASCDSVTVRNRVVRITATRRRTVTVTSQKVAA